MKDIKQVSVFLAFAFTAACATTPPEPPKSAVLSLDNKTCETQVSTENSLSLTPEKKALFHIVTTDINAGSKCVDIEGKKANYIVYAIPAAPQNHTITIGGAMDVLRTFAPDVSIIDVNGKVSRSFNPDQYAYLGYVYGVQFRPSENDRFIIVKSDPKLVGVEKSALETRVNVGYGYSPGVGGYGTTYNTYTGSEAKKSRVFSHEGIVSVTIQAIKGKIGLPDEK